MQGGDSCRPVTESFNLAGCFDINPAPEDNTDFTASPASGQTVSDLSSDLVNFDLAMELSTPPTPASAPFTIGTTSVGAAQVATGRQRFVAIGCANCHTPDLRTATSSYTQALTHARIRRAGRASLPRASACADSGA